MANAWSQAMSFEELDAFLMSGRVPDDSMLLSDLDGFLTGIVVSPDLIMPSEWLPRIWGDGNPDFESEAEANAVIGAIMGRYNAIAQQVSHGREALDPVFWESADGDVIAGDWAEGFLDAVRLRPQRWMELFEDEEARVLVAPIVALTCDEAGAPFVDADDEEVARLNREAASLIPAAVAAIDQFWKERRASGDPADREAPGHARKVGRNAPCPCGSGRKFKRCCGAR